MNADYFDMLPLQGQNALLRSVMGSLPQIVLILDLDTQTNLYVSRNILETIGYSSDEIQAMGNDVLPALLHPDDFARIPALFARMRALHDQETFVSVDRWRTRAGTYKTFRNRVLPFARHNDGQLASVLCISQDISYVVKAQDIILEQLRAISDTSHALSHDLRHEHARILGAINVSNLDADLTRDELRLLSNAISDGANRLDDAIKRISQSLSSIRQEFGKINLETN